MDPTYGVGVLILVLILLGVYAILYGHPDD